MLGWGYIARQRGHQTDSCWSGLTFQYPPSTPLHTHIHFIVYTSCINACTAYEVYDMYLPCQVVQLGVSLWVYIGASLKPWHLLQMLKVTFSIWICYRTWQNSTIWRAAWEEDWTVLTERQERHITQWHKNQDIKTLETSFLFTSLFIWSI